MDLVLQETCLSSQVLKIWRLIYETSVERLFIKFRQITQHLLSRLNMINSSTTARSIENYDFKIFRSEIQPRLV